MDLNTHNPVLIIGGSGTVGSQAARTLRRLHPGLPIVIGGRDVAKAAKIAAEIGNARGLGVSLDRRDLGLSANEAFSAVVPFLKDPSMNALRFAQETGAAFVSLSSGVFEIGQETAHYIHRPQSVPVLMASNWLAGAATFPTLQALREYRRVDSIDITVVLDEQDMGGPAAAADFERLTSSAPRPLIVKGGAYVWAGPEDAARKVTVIDGTQVEAQAYAPFDVLSLSALTGAPSIRLDLVYGMSSSRRRGEPFSTEIIIEISGEKVDGTSGKTRQELMHPEGQAPVTALAVTMGIERLLGLEGGPPAAPGLYFPENLIEPDYAADRFREFGMRTERKEQPAGA
jgi:hypothetical protein